jgi:tetratricopeptide (TPR) repeat protein
MLSVLVAGVVAATQMGAIAFPVSGSPTCNKKFTDGMLALHSFMYERAHEHFQAAVKADPRCAMARWGDAMAYNHPFWGEEDLPRARAALAAVVEEPKLARKERAYLSAARTLIADGTPRTRLAAWLVETEHMRKEFAADDEVALQHALALIANSARLSDLRKLAQAAAIGLDVLQRRPRHPGAAHYVIHACDTPELAILALPAAERYAQIAPAASHAQHMPSHIFVQLGMWERVARSNEVAWPASQKEAAGKPIDKYDWHSYSWLAAAHLELGQHGKARKLLDELASAIAREDNRDPRFAYSLIARLYLNETGAWDHADEILRPIAGPLPREAGDPDGSLGCAQHAPGGALDTRPPAGLQAHERLHLIRAEAAMRRGDEAGVRKALEALTPIHNAMNAWAGMMPPSMIERRKATEAALVWTARAYRSRGDGTIAAALAALKRLAELGDPFASGPPFDPPAKQWLAELQLAVGRPKDALATYDALLLDHPRLAAGLLGAARAAKAAGEVAAASARYAELADLWKSADASLPGLAEARAGAGAVAGASR